MTYITSWEEFARAAEKLYLSDPMKVSISVENRGNRMVVGDNQNFETRPHINRLTVLLKQCMQFQQLPYGESDHSYLYHFLQRL